jgi:hypothetical protein
VMPTPSSAKTQRRLAVEARTLRALDSLTLSSVVEIIAAYAPQIEAVARTPMGYAEIAAYLNVKPRTVNTWKARDILPPADLVVHGLPTWWDTTITRWADVTGRTSDS